MSAPTLFELPIQPSNTLQARARRTDGVTAHAAARKMESGNGPLMQHIRREAEYQTMLDLGPITAFSIATGVRLYTQRWKEGTIRSAVSRAPFLRHVDNDGRVPDTGNACRRYVLKVAP